MTIDSLLGGGYLLSHFRSTIGVVRLNFSVRNGKRWDPHAMTTLFYLFSPDRASCMCGGCRILKKTIGGTLRAKTFSRLLLTEPNRTRRASRLACCIFIALRTDAHTGGPARGSRQESFRVISTARLRTLPPVHLPPINVVVCNDPNKEILS